MNTNNNANNTNTTSVSFGSISPEALGGRDPMNRGVRRGSPTGLPGGTQDQHSTRLMRAPGR